MPTKTNRNAIGATSQEIRSQEQLGRAVYDASQTHYSIDLFAAETLCPAELRNPGLNGLQDDRMTHASSQ